MFILGKFSFTLNIIKKLHGTGNHIRISLVVAIVLLGSIHSSDVKSLSDVPLIKQSFAATVSPLSESINSRDSRYSHITQVAIHQEKSVITKQEFVPWGKAKQIDEHTWTMQTGSDTAMGNAVEILAALNSYRQKKGVSPVSQNDTLSVFSQNRAEYFSKIGKLDSHAGFQNMMNDNGFEKMGFNSLGENSSFGYTLSGVHLIEWVYAGDKPHDDNQLKTEWTHVGVGVSGNATDLVFGGRKR